MSEQPNTRTDGERRRRRTRSDRRSSGNRNNSSRSRSSTTESRAPRQPKNPIVAFFKRIFGLENSANPNPRTERRDRSRSDRAERTPRPERTDSAPNGSASAEPKLDLNEITTPKLYIGNLSYDASESDLFDLFSSVGSVQNIEIARDKNMNSKGFGFAEMASVEAARALAEKFHRTQFMDRQLVVTGARKP